MPSIERDASRDGDRHLKHQHSSSSDTGKSLVPMWDSSDPERAPPPLPMNPSSPLTSTSRPNTSSAIQSAHLALTEKARESGYITNPPPKRIESPERSLIKGAAHKRMQSLQTGNVRDLSSFLESGSTFGSRSPEKASVRPSTPHTNKDFFYDIGKSPEKSPEKESRRSVLLLEAGSPEKDRSRSSTPTPHHEPPSRDTPTLRPSLRRPPQSILGENNPPQSATMLALQNMPNRDVDAPLSNVTNGSTALVRTPQTFDAISNQILSLTSIATALQREMAQLSRRSKDNATDLVSLKEATNARDEDIRKSLRELVTNLADNSSRPASLMYGHGHGHGHNGLYIDNKSHGSHGSPNSSRIMGSPGSSSNAVKPFTLPRIPSPNSFAESLNRESIGSPCVYNPEGMASIAILEKILREMGTKEGQDLLVTRLQAVADLLAKDGSATAQKLDDLLDLIKANASHVLVSQNGGGGGGANNNNRSRNFSFDEAPRLELDFEQPRSVAQRALAPMANKENASHSGGSVINEETVKLIRTIKDSVAQGGGLTAEVKALVRELRGEVLGMGREMGRKIDQASTESAKDSAADKEKVARIVQDGLAQLKEHMDQILREHRRQSAADSTRNAVDYQEIYQAVRSAISEDHESRNPEAEKEDIIRAVKEAWENYKPDIEVQQFGLEREELLTCLKEGIQEYAPADREPGATREEVFAAVIEGLKHFSPPRIEAPPSLSRDEILDAVRECLEEFEFPSAPAPEPLETGITRDDMLDAVKEGLHTFDFAASTTAVTRDVGESLSRDDVLDAVKEGLHTFDFPNINAVMSREMNDTLSRDDMVSAVKEGLHTFDFAAEGVNKDDMLDAVKEGLHTFDFATAGGLSRDTVLDAVKQGLHDFEFPTSTTTLSGEDILVLRDEVVTSVKELLESASLTSKNALTRDIGESITRDDMLDAVKEGLQSFDFGSSSSTALTRGPPESLTRDDIADIVNETLHNFDFPTHPSGTSRDSNGHMQRDDIIDAVLHSLRSFDFAANTTALTRNVGGQLDHDAIVDAVTDSLRSFDFAANTTALSRDVSGRLEHDQIADAVTQSLRSFDFAANTTALSREVSGRMEREEIIDAITEALHSFDFSANTSTALTRDVGGGLSKEDVYDAVKAGIEDAPQVHTAHVNQDEIIDAVKAGLDSFDFAATTSHALSREVGGSLTKDDVYDAVKAGLEGTPQTDGNLSGTITERLEEIMDVIRTEFKTVSEEARQNVAANGRDTEQLLDATKDGLERLRSDIETYVDRAADINGKDELLDRMRESFDALRTEVELLSAQGSSNSSLEVVRGELDQLRETMATSLVRGSDGADKDEIIEVLKQGLESIRGEMDRPRDSNESILSGTGEILDALHDGLNAVRSEVENLGNKPVDMTVNYEILDTLKLGLEGIRADIDRLRENENQDRAVAEINSGAVVPAEGLKRNDIENLEVLITQLRIKVEALESMPPPPPQPIPGSLSREDLDPVHDMLRNVHESVNNMSGQSRSVDEDGIKREDFEAIETLLRNTKAKIDEIDPEQAVKKEHLDAVEVLILETRATLTELATQLEDVSKRDDVNNVESLVRDVLGSLQEMKDKAEEETEDLEKVTKTDVEAVEAVCHDIKVLIGQQVLSDIANLASKEDFKNMEEMVKEFKGRVEVHEEKNAKAFEERQAETVGVGERVSEIKEFLQDLKDSVKEKLEEGASSVDDLAKILDGLGDTISKNANVSDDVKEMFEIMKSEFEKSNAGVVGTKLEADEKFQLTWDKFDSKLDEKFDELMTKYDDAQTAAEIQTRLGEERSAESEAALLAAKTVAEEVKILIDTLGTTLTDSIEKMDEASKTVFNRVDETFTRVEETHADAKAEHQLTREQVFKTLGAIEGVQGHVEEYNPKILDSIKDVLSIVGQHYEHSKESAVTLQEKIAERPPPPEVPLLKEAPVEKYDDSQVHEKLDRLVEKSDFTPIHEKLDKLVENSDYAPVHEKLDKLVDHTHAAGKSFAQLDMLDQIHQQVMKTAAEVSEFVSNQTQRIANDHEDKERALEETTIALEKRMVQKEHVEAAVISLREEEERLKESVAILKAEQEDLAHQKMRLAADVSSLETALRIRREELHAMEAQAEGLERRILEGVIDHSRALLVNRGNKGRDAMSRKRVPSQATSTTGSILSNATGTSRASQSTQSAVSMAMSGKRAIVNVPINNGASRRILSLNQITHNVPTGNFKRSHSVKTNTGAGALRKSSWGGSMSQKYGDLNKENLALKESEEDDAERSEGEGSETGTMRRSSRGTTIMTGTGASDSIDESTEWTGSQSGSEYLDSHLDPEPVDESVVEEPGNSTLVLYEEGGQLV
ncbi:related to transport protein USO1 [Phialocephala subalpina]|uniref:Related to transport protein USO1 n=1 Tax=Phialocephala subalpina TaxID=576137 RepID=A0A1L7WYW9_9HELO|nr:related to transport protein USO1 [Phialocephala subalpina]